TEVRLFHPFQQLMLVHAASRFCEHTSFDSLSNEEKSRRWALASLQVNDLMPRAEIPEQLPRPEKALLVFAEEAARWELANPSSPNHSVARLRSLLISDVPRAGASESEAAERITRLVADAIGLEFSTAADLTAFLAYWWRGAMNENPHNPDAATIDLEKW